MVVKVAKKISTWMSSFNVRVKTFHVICRNIRDTHRDSLWITTSPIFVRLFDLNMNILIKPHGSEEEDKEMHNGMNGT